MVKITMIDNKQIEVRETMEEIRSAFERDDFALVTERIVLHDMQHLRIISTKYGEILINKNHVIRVE